MGDFSVVANLAEIKRLNHVLGQRLRKTMPFLCSRELTYPSGHHSADVYFEGKSGTHVRAWAPAAIKDGLQNFILQGDPTSTAWMQIEVQLNFPATKYSRQFAGAFVKDANGEISIAHRGKLTRGHGAISKEKVFRAFADQTIEAEDNGLTSTLILISPMDDKTLPDRLWRFASDAREVANRLIAEAGTQDPATSNAPSGKVTAGRTTPTQASNLGKLREYFDEFSGKTDRKGYRSGVRVVEHGDVVRALNEQMTDSGASQKSQAIDLAIVTASMVDLFEVKTSDRTTDVYTGLGQLFIHGASLGDRLKVPVRKHLVLPKRPYEALAKILEEKGEVNIVQYEKRGGGYHFTNLP